MLKYIMFFMFMFFIKKYWLMKEIMLLMFFILFIMLLPSFYNNIYYFFYIDMMSYGLIILTSWIILLMLLSSEKIKMLNLNIKDFIYMNLFLLLFLFLSFSVMDLFLYYLFFEMSLIPTLMLILGWGYQPERIQAGMYLLFYTLLVSLPLLMSIFFFYNNNLTLFFFFFNKFIKFNSIMQLILILAFLVKMPMFLVHLWLPKAHVEAPIAGSMILAGILLKLGGYGLLRILPLLLYFNKFIIYYLISINLFGSLLISISCLNQIDFKSLIAYSSVVHMGLILSSIFNFSIWSFNSSYLMMIAHGLCSSGMFFLANISYERLMNRSLMISKGLLSFMPSFSLWWFLLLTSNMAAPPSMNLLSEIGLLNSILNWSIFCLIILIFLFFFSAAYCIYLFSISQHGMMYSMLYSHSNNFIREYLILFLHWFPLNILILKSEYFMLWI